MDIREIIKERGKISGDWPDNSRITQRLKEVIWSELNNKDKKLSDSQAEALDMMMHKFGRIISGDENYEDHWLDIIGYAQLVLDELRKNNN